MFSKTTDVGQVCLEKSQEYRVEFEANDSSQFIPFIISISVDADASPCTRQGQAARTDQRRFSRRLCRMEITCCSDGVYSSTPQHTRCSSQYGAHCSLVNRLTRWSEHYTVDMATTCSFDKSGKKVSEPWSLQVGA